MKWNKSLIILVFFSLLMQIVFSEQLDPSSGTLDFGGSSIYGTGFSLGESGSLSCSSCEGKIGEFDLLGSFSGKSENGILKGTSSANGATIAGIVLPSGTNFAFNSKTGEMKILPSAEKSSITQQGRSISLESGSEAQISKEGKITLIGRSEITDESGNKAKGEDITYDPSKKLFSSPKELTIQTPDGKSAFGKDISISFEQTNTAKAREFLSERKNGVVFFDGQANYIQQGRIEVSASKDGFMTKTIGLQQETTIERRSDKIYYEYSGTQRNIARTDIEYMVGNEKFTAVTLQVKSGDSIVSNVFAPSLNPASKPSSLIGEVRTQTLSLIDASKSFSMMDLDQNSLKGKFHEGLQISSNVPTPKIVSSSLAPSVKEGKESQVLSFVTETPISGTLTSKITLTFDQNELSEFNSKPTWQQNLVDFIEKGKEYGAEIEIEHSKGRLASYYMIDSLKDGFVVAGINTHQIIKGIEDNVEKGSVKMSLDPSGILTVSKTSSSPNPVEYQLSQQTLAAYKKEHLQSAVPALLKNMPQEVTARLSELFRPGKTQVAQGNRP